MYLKRYLKRLTGSVKGELGDATNPVCCDGSTGAENYLNRLRDSSGKGQPFVCIGSTDKGPYGNTLDLYGFFPVGLPHRSVYMDLHHRNHVELKPIPGYFILNLGGGKIDLTPPRDKGNLAELTKFAHKLSDAAKGDGPTLRQFLNSPHSDSTCSSMIVFALSLIALSYGDDREKVVNGLVRNPSFRLDYETANKLYTFLVGE